MRNSQQPQIEESWTQSDAIALRTFLNACPNFMGRLMDSHRPKIKGSTIEARAMSGSDLNGFLICMDAIKSMQSDPTVDSEEAGFIPGGG